MDAKPRKSKDLLKNSFALEAAIEPFLTSTRVEITNDGQYLLCPYQNSIKVLSLENGKVVKSLFGTDDDELILQFVLSPDDNTIVTAHSNGLLKRLSWKEDPPRIERVWKSIHTGPISRICYDSTSVLLATGGSDSTIKVWDTDRNYCTHNLKGARGVFSAIAFKPITSDDSDLSEHGSILFGSADDYDIHAWDLKSNKNHVATMEGHSAAVTSIKFSSNAKIMITSSRDKIVILWDTSNFTSIKTIPIYESLESLALMPKVPKSNESSDDSVCITSVGEEGILKFWRFDYTRLTCAQVTIEEVDHPGAMLTQALYNAASNKLVSVTSEQNIMVYDATTLELIRQFAGLCDEVLDVKFLGPDDSHLLVATNSPVLKVYDLKTLSCKIYKAHEDIIVSIHVFSSDRLTVATSSKDNTLLIWRFDSETMEGKCLFKGTGHAHTVTCVSGSNEGVKFIVSASEDLTLKLWDVPSHTPTSAEPLVAKVTQHGHDKSINAVTISPNDAIVATGSQDKTAKLWAASNLKLLGTLSGHRRGIWFLKFSPVDRVIATASGDSTIKIWSIQDFACLKTLQGHESSVLDIEFVARGMQLITSSSDGMVKLWLLKTAECTKTFDAHEGKIWSLDVSQDESLLVSGSSDGLIKIWRDTTQLEAEQAIQKQQDFVQQEQILSNLLQRKKWTKALRVAILLEQPFRCLTIIKEILLEPEGPIVLHETLIKLRQDQLISLLKFCMTWNTNSRHCYAAQCTLNTIFKTISPSEMDKLPGFKSTVESLTPYTMKHYERVCRLTQQAAFADFVWNAMRLPDVDKLSLTDTKRKTTPRKAKESNMQDHESSQNFQVEESLLQPYSNGDVFFIDKGGKDEKGQGDIVVENLEGDDFVAGSESENEEEMTFLSAKSSPADEMSPRNTRNSIDEAMKNLLSEDEDKDIASDVQSSLLSSDNDHTKPIDEDELLTDDE